MDIKDVCLYLMHAGFSIRPSALKILHQHMLENASNQTPENFLDEVIRTARELRDSGKMALLGSSLILEDEQIKRILSSEGLPEEKVMEEIESKFDQKIRSLVENSIIVLSAYEGFPYLEKWEFDGRMKVVDPKNKAFFGESEDKIMAHLNRFHLLESLLFRNDSNYTRLLKDEKKSNEPMIIEGEEEKKEEIKKYIEIPYINGLLGVSKTMQIFGTLIKKDDMNFYLEDTTRSVKLNVKESVTLGSGFFLEGNTLIATGNFRNDSFELKELAHPPNFRITLPKPTEMDYFGAYNYAKNKIAKDNDSENLGNTLAQSTILTSSNDPNIKEKMMIILSNVYLDNHRVMSRLKEFFSGIEQLQPSVIVLMGTLFSQPQRTFSELKQYITQFSLCVQEFEFICSKTMWIIMPAPEDPGVTHLFPRKPIPECLLEPLKKKVKTIINTTNPTRISFYGKELIFSRCNLLQNFKRLSVFSSTAFSDIQNVVDTVMAQRSVIPISYGNIPVVWNYAHCMSFYNPPHYLVLGDICSSYEKTVDGCVVLNPGNFSKDFSFVVLYPLLGKVEPSKLP